MNTNKKRTLLWISIGLIVLLLVMLMTTPNKEKINNWVMKKHGIDCEYDNNVGNVCYQDGVKIKSKSGHFQNAAIYASYEINYTFENEQRQTYRVLGVLGILFKMDEGLIWEVFN